MTRTDTLLRLKRFRVDEMKRRIASIDAMKADLERKLADLDDNVAREKQRAGDSDIGRLAFPSFLRSIEARRENLRTTLKEIEREYDLESVPSRGGGPLLWKVRSGEMPRKVELRRTQAYALLAARRLFEPMRGSALFEEIDLAVGKLLAFAQRPGRGPNAGLADARLEERFLYLPHAPKNYAE